MKLPMLSNDDKLAEIRRLYFETTRQTIQADIDKALDLLKSMPSEEERERASVYMDGMAQMRRDWRGDKKKGSGFRAQGSGGKGSGRQEAKGSGRQDVKGSGLTPEGAGGKGSGRQGATGSGLRPEGSPGKGPGKKDPKP